MTTAQLNCNTGIDITRKICGLTILERTILACYYAGIKNIELLSESGSIAIPVSAEILPDLKCKIKKSKDKPFKNNSFSKGNLSINVSSIINKEYVIALTGGPEAMNQVYEELTDKESYKKAQKTLLNSLRKPGEAFSSHYYRYLSLLFTKYLCRTSVTPNMITLFLAVLAAVGGLMIINDRWYVYYIGLILQVLALVFDCVDGEIARIKYKFSKNGDWIDSAGDNACTLFFVIAIAIKNHDIYQSSTSYVLGIISVVFYVLAVFSLFFTLFKTTSSGSLQTITREVGKKGALLKFFSTLLKRNIVTPILMVLGFFYLTQTILILNIIAGFGLMVFSIVSLIKAMSDKGVKA